MLRTSRYFGFVTLILCWISLATVAAIHSPNWSEPISQFGYYPQTRYVFALTITLAAITWYLFSLHLNPYWQHTSLITLLAGVCFIIIGWVPYEPYVRGFIFDLHNAAVLLAAVLYALPLLFIAYAKKHEEIAQVSRVLFFAIILFAGWSIIARVYDLGIIYAQFLTLLPMQIWLIMTNKLLLQRKEIASGHTGKL